MRLPESEREIMLGIVRQFGNAREVPADRLAGALGTTLSEMLAEVERDIAL